MPTLLELPHQITKAAAEDASSSATGQETSQTAAQQTAEPSRHPGSARVSGGRLRGRPSALTNWISVGRLQTLLDQQAEQGHGDRVYGPFLHSPEHVKKTHRRRRRRPISGPVCEAT